MSDKNFMSYGDAETVLTEFANDIKSKTSVDDASSSYSKTYSSEKIEQIKDELLAQTTQIINRNMNLIWEDGYFDGYGNIAHAQDFIHSKIPVYPGQKLYFDWYFHDLVLTFYRANGSTLVIGDAYANDPITGVFTVPNNSNIAYMSIPVRSGYCNTVMITDKEISSDGLLPNSIFRSVAGQAPSIVPVTEEERIPKVTRQLVETSDSSGGIWTYAYMGSNDAYFTAGVGFIILGITSDYKVLAFNRDNGQLILFTSGSDFSMLGTVSGLSGLTTILTVYDSTNKANYEINIRSVRITHYSNKVVFRGVEGNILSEVSYSTINSAISSSGFTMDDFTKVIGTIYLKNSDAYPSRAAYASWRSPTALYEYRNNNAVTNWSGKGWWAYGTSMTIDSNGYCPNLASKAGLVLHNYGLNGSGIIPSLHASDNIKTRCMRTSDGKADADLITIEIIPNDMNGTLGTPTSTGNDTFLGNLNQILQYLLENCPKAQIVVLTATKARYAPGSPSTVYPPESQESTNWITWEDGIREVCRRQCVQYWDGTSECGLGYHRVKSATSGNTYVEDQIHLTDAGGKNLANYFYNKLKDLPIWYKP